MIKRKILIFLVALFVVMSVLIFSSVPTANAADPTGCEQWDGIWAENETTATCTFPPDVYYSTNFCPERHSGVDMWIKVGDIWEFSNRTCNPVYGGYNPIEASVTHGTPIDAWNGNCGAYISNPPINGSVIVSRYLQKKAPNLQRTCEVDYFDWQGNQLPRFGSPGWVYYNLDSNSAKLWDDKKLNIYFFKNGDWEMCSNPIFVDAGKWGRLSCYSENPSRFGIGTMLKNVKNKPGPNPFGK